MVSTSKKSVPERVIESISTCPTNPAPPGRGTRKRAAAHAVLVRGTGLFRVNGQQELCQKRWSRGGVLRNTWLIWLVGYVMGIYSH